MAKDYITVESLLPVIKEKRGNISAVARHFNCSRFTIYQRINESTTLQQAREDARQTVLDEAEDVFFDKVLEGNTKELLFFLRTQGRKRGYGKEQKITHSVDVKELSDDELRALAEG